MASFLLIILFIVFINRSCAVGIEYDDCSNQDGWSGNGGITYATDDAGCIYSRYCHRLNGADTTTTTVAGEIEKRFDTTGYSDIYIQFDISTTGFGFGSHEFCWVLYSIDNGVNWIEINKYSWENDGSNRYIYFPPSANDNYNFKIKFQNTANEAVEYCYIDGIALYGTSPKNIRYDSSIRIFEDDAMASTDTAWTWTGNNNQGNVHYNCLAYIGCDTCACFQIMGGLFSTPGTVHKLISTAGYIHISVEFNIRSTGIDTNEYCIAWYTDNGGNNWYEIDSFDFTNDGKRYYFLPESCSDNNQFGLRFTIKAYSISEVCYIDVIRVNGDLPTPSPTNSPTHPTIYPTSSPTSYPTSPPTNNPSISPSTAVPTSIPTFLPSNNPSYHPTLYPSSDPTYFPTKYPTTDPSIDPSVDPTVDPTHNPTNHPTLNPTHDPSTDPTYIPTMNPTFTYNPTTHPTNTPTFIPTVSPTSATKEPTLITMSPTQPNGQVSEKTTITKMVNNNNNEDDQDDDDNNDNQQQLLNININIDIRVLVILIAICMVLICFVIFICFWCLMKKSKRKHKAEETKFVRSSNTQQTVMETNKSGEEMEKTQQIQSYGLDLFRVASMSSIGSIDLLSMQQQQTLENATTICTSTDANINDDDEEEGSSMYRIDAPNNDNDDNHNDNNNDDDDGDDTNWDDMYSANDKVTKGNNVTTPTEIVLAIETGGK